MCSMRAYDFIFSEGTKHRWFRHVALWVVFCLYFFIVNFSPRTAADLIRSKTYLDAFERMIYIPISILSVYLTIYYLLPRYALKGKYVRFLILLFGLCMVSVVNAFLLTGLLGQLTGKDIFSKIPAPFKVFQPIAYGLGLSLSASGFAGIIKLLKIRYLRQKENERLQQQKITTEIQLLRTQVHPSFLSDALRQISLLIRHHSVQSPVAILKLADLLSYTLYQNDQDFIKLEKELLTIEEYLALESILHGNRVTFHFKKAGAVSEMKIVPMIFLSLVQDCCGQFLDSSPRKLSINISIKVENKRTIFRLNCRAPYRKEGSVSQQNLDLSQEVRRLQVVYPDRYHLQTHYGQGIYSVLLMLQSDNVSEPPVVNLTKTAVYGPA